MTRRLKLAIALAAALSSVTVARPVFADENWPRFRGPDGSGVCPTADVPTKWDAKSVVWRTEIDGRGQSSPVIWGNRIFLTSALDNGRERLVVAIDRNTGKILWKQTAWKGNPEPSHKMNGWASPTCVTDGTHVWAWFGKAGAHCYTVEGKPVWSQQLGEFKIKTGRGTGSSLALTDTILVVNGDSESDPYLFGLDKRTGKTVWKVERPATEGYSTPMIVNVEGRNQIILNGDSYVAGYEPATGAQIWLCKSFNGRGEPSPAMDKNGNLYLVNGQPGDVYAVKLGGEGDVTKTHMLWHTKRNDGRDQPSPIVVGDYLLVSNLAGILSCYETKSGKFLWKQRMGDGAQICSSPIAATDASGKARGYFTLEDGQTFVIEPTPTEGKVVSTSVVKEVKNNELFRSSLAVVDGVVFVRSDQALYCVK